ncbi:MAG TPA: hypothetical protein VKZ59_04435, partial [Acidobacteriota bacterium]|nr:hypothetical protein [Acidobacteriota bacterium]
EDFGNFTLVTTDSAFELAMEARAFVNDLGRYLSGFESHRSATVRRSLVPGNIEVSTTMAGRCVFLSH